MAKKYKLAAIAGLAVVLVVVLLAGQALAQTGTATPGGMMGGNTTGGNAGMMGGNATGNAGMMASGTVTPTVSGQNTTGSSSGATGVQPYGMMGPTQGMPYGAYGYGMMGGTNSMPYGMMSMMGTSGGWSDPNAKPLTLDQAQASAQRYIQALPNNAGANLAPMEVMEFSNGFYVAVGDKTTNTGAFEVLVDRYDGSLSPEPGPNMMWNTKYGMMSGSPVGGMMGMMGGQQGAMGVMGGSMAGMMGLWSPPPATPTLSQEQVRTNAQQFLALKFPTAKLPADMMTFPGYSTLDFEVNGQPAGMLSVNAYTGRVWYHTWHGQFLSERSMQTGS